MVKTDPSMAIRERGRTQLALASVGAMATIGLKAMENPLDFGIVITRDDGSIERFLEKPTWGQVFSDTINTGIFVLEPEIFDYIEPDRPVDFSGEVFPKLLEEGRPLYGAIAEGYWEDVGTLEAYVRAHKDVLDGKVEFITGDLIKYRDAYGKTAFVKRLQLTNRQDVIQTWANHKYLGEIIYMDDSRTEIRTPTGSHKLANIWIKNIVMGSPSAFNNSDHAIESPSQTMSGFEDLSTPRPLQAEPAGTGMYSAPGTSGNGASYRPAGGAAAQP